MVQKMNHWYLGHPSQLFGVEEHRLVGGKGDGMRLFEVKNGKGMELTVSADRCADIARLSYKGDNMGYFSPAGYVAPAYYDDKGTGFLKSFTAVCMEGAIIVLSCIIFSLFASSPPVVDTSAAAVTQVWKYIGELIFNMLVLVGTIKMSDRVVREMMGL